MLGLDEPDDPASRRFDVALSVPILLSIAALDREDEMVDDSAWLRED